MKYFNFKAEVAGGLGPHSITREVPGELIVYQLHYVFDGWCGDEIVESTPCYIVTEQLADTISDCGLTGVNFDEVQTGCSDCFRELHPDQSLPAFVWMKVCGRKLKDDFFFAGYGRLVISERALEVIRAHVAHATITDFVDV